MPELIYTACRSLCRREMPIPASNGRVRSRNVARVIREFERNT
jgi:hypothetical protein